jgi:hypothetical protein
MAHIIRFDEGYRFDAGWYWGQLVPDIAPKKGKRMPADFIPSNWADYRAWLLNMHTEIDTEGPKFGLTAGAITAIKNTCQAEIDKIDAYNGALSAADAALETVKDGKGITDTALREDIGDWKTADGWTDAIAAKLRVVSTKTAFDPNTYKPEYTVKILGGEIRIDFKKRGVDGVRVYRRLKGQTSWTFLALDTSSPYIDGHPLAQPGVPEVREYMLRGVIDDVEIGLDSDIQSVTWAGN